MSATSKYDMAAFVATINATGAVSLVELNAALSLVNGSDVGAAYFVAWHEAFLALGINVTYYAFGNENYGGWEPPYGDYPVDGTLYGEAFAVASAALKAKYPHVQLGCVVYDDDKGTDDGARRALALRHGGADSDVDAEEVEEAGAAAGDGDAAREAALRDHAPTLGAIISDWTADVFATDARGAADFLVLHNYFTSGSDTPSDAELLAEVDVLDALAADMQAAWDAAAGDDGDDAATMPPLTLSELSSVDRSRSTTGVANHHTYGSRLFH